MAESYYTYRPSYAVAVRAPHGIDVHAGYSPWPGGLGEVLSGPPGVRVVHFLPIRPHHRTGLLRLESGLSAVAGQRGVLVRSSWARRLARVAGHRPQPPGSRLVYNSWSFFNTRRVSLFNPSVYTNTPRDGASPLGKHVGPRPEVPSGREVQLPAPAGEG